MSLIIVGLVAAVALAAVVRGICSRRPAEKGQSEDIYPPEDVYPLW